MSVYRNTRKFDSNPSLITNFVYLCGMVSMGRGSAREFGKFCCGEIVHYNVV